MEIKHFKDGVLTQTIPDKPEELAEKQAIAQIKKSINMIDSISNLTELKSLLKKLALRLVEKGYLP